MLTISLFVSLLVSKIVREQILSCLKTGKKITKIKKCGKKAKLGRSLE